MRCVGSSESAHTQIALGRFGTPLAGTSHRQRCCRARSRCLGLSTPDWEEHRLTEESCYHQNCDQKDSNNFSVWKFGRNFWVPSRNDVAYKGHEDGAKRQWSKTLWKQRSWKASLVLSLSSWTAQLVFNRPVYKKTRIFVCELVLFSDLWEFFVATDRARPHYYFFPRKGLSTFLPQTTSPGGDFQWADLWCSAERKSHLETSAWMYFWRLERVADKRWRTGSWNRMLAGTVWHCSKLWARHPWVQCVWIGCIDAISRTVSLAAFTTWQTSNVLKCLIQLDSEDMWRPTFVSLSRRFLSGRPFLRVLFELGWQSGPPQRSNAGSQQAGHGREEILGQDEANWSWAQLVGKWDACQQHWSTFVNQIKSVMQTHWFQ